MNNSQIYYLFVYGSLRSGFKSPAYEYISRFFDFAGDGKVRGKLYDLGEYSGAVPAEEDSFIVGELYRIKDQSRFSWAIAQLDDYEGIDPEPGHEKLYRRDMTPALVDGQEIPAWIYWYNGNVAGKPIIASGDLMVYLKGKQ